VSVSKILSTGIELRIVPVLSSIVIAIVTFMGYIKVVLAGGIGKNGSTVAVSRIFNAVLNLNFY